MKAAVVGAGFSGLAVTHALLSQGAEVDLYDRKGVGAGASGVASGLLHPYAGEQVRRSLYAEEALEESKKLLLLAQQFSSEPVADFSGVLRKVGPEQVPVFLEHADRYGDVERVGELLFLIRSGVTVYSKAYLDGLWKACLAKGMHWNVQHIESFRQLERYDLFVLCLGNGFFSFKDLDPSTLSIGRVKGQALVCRKSKHFSDPSRSLLGKVHVVPLPGENRVYVGSTYERDVDMDESPCLEKALRELKPKLGDLIPGCLEDLEVEEVHAGIRVTRRGDYFPLIQNVGKKGFLVTAMGSRGLLYHAYAAKRLVQLISAADSNSR